MLVAEVERGPECGCGTDVCCYTSIIQVQQHLQSRGDQTSVAIIQYTLNIHSVASVFNCVRRD